MRRNWLGAGALLIGLSACHDPDAGLPAPYRTIRVPDDVTAASPEARERGRVLFLASCALCHGERADGRGARRAALSSSPVDFTRRSWCRKTTPRAVYHVVREGVRGTAMPGWKALTEDQCWDLVAYLLSVCEQGP